MSEPVIEVRHLSKSFGTHVVLRDVDFTVNSGEYAAGHLVAKGAELAARAALERLAHQVHAEEEQSQPADHREHIENIHMFYLSFFLF